MNYGGFALFFTQYSVNKWCHVWKVASHNSRINKYHKLWVRVQAPPLLYVKSPVSLIAQPSLKNKKMKTASLPSFSHFPFPFSLTSSSPPGNTRLPPSKPSVGQRRMRAHYFALQPSYKHITPPASYVFDALSYEAPASVLWVACVCGCVWVCVCFFGGFRLTCGWHVCLCDLSLDRFVPFLFSNLCEFCLREACVTQMVQA